MMNTNKKFNGLRRRFLQAVGAGLIACDFRIGNALGASKNMAKFKVLVKDDRFDIGNRGKRYYSEFDVYYTKEFQYIRYIIYANYPSSDMLHQPYRNLP